MATLLILFLLIDLLASFYLYKEAFVVRSNMRKKNKKRFVAMVAVIVGSLIALVWKNIQVACLIAGIPAGLISLFIVALAIAMFSHKGPWN